MTPPITILIASATLAAAALAASPAEAATSAPMRLRNKAQNLCLDPPGTDGGDHGGVGRPAACTGARDQYLILTEKGELKNELKGHCIDNGARLVACDGSAGQTWTLIPAAKSGGWFQLKNGGGNCLIGQADSVELTQCGTLTDERLWSWESTGMALVNTPQVERTFVAADTGLCLGVKNNSKSLYTPIVQVPCGNTEARFELVPSLETPKDAPTMAIRSRSTGLCVGVPNRSNLDGVGLEQYTCHYGDLQRFSLIDDGAGAVNLVTVAGKCLEFASTGQGAPLVQRSCGAGPFASRQRFEVTGPRPRRLRNVANGLCLDPAGFTGGHVKMSVAPCDDGRDQLFVRNNDWELISAAQGKCLDVAGVDGNKGELLWLYKCDNHDDQRWTLYGGTSTFELKNKAHNHCADLPGFVGKSGDPLALWTCDGGKDQRWSWDTSYKTWPEPAPMPLKYAATGGGKGKVCAPGGKLCVSGTFTAGQGGLLDVSGDVAVETPLGGWTLKDAQLSVDLAEPRIAGSAKVSIPGLGLLAGIVGTEIAADVVIGPGGGSAELKSGTFALSPDKFYVYARFKAQSSFKLAGGLTIDLVPSSVLLVEPSSPTVYLAGAAIQLLPNSPLSAFEAIGFSLGSCFPHTLDKETRTPGGGEARRSVCGNIFAAAKADYKIFTGKGTMVIDIDGGDDGKTIFTGDPQDFRIAFDGLGQISAVALDIPLVSVSMYFDGKQARAELAGSGNKDNLFEGTPLAALDTGGAVTGVQVSIDGTHQDFWFRVPAPKLLGWTAYALEADMSWAEGKFSAATVKAELKLPFGDPKPKLDLAGVFKSASSWSISGSGAVTLGGGIKIASGTATLSDAGLAFKGKGSLGKIAGFTLDGKLASPSSFELKSAFGVEGSYSGASAKGTATVTVDEDGADARFQGSVAIDGAGKIASYSTSIDSAGKICFSINLGFTKVSKCVELSIDL